MNRDYLDRAAAFGLGAITALVFAMALLAGHADGDARALSEAREDTAAQVACFDGVSDRPIPAGTYMPLYLQTDAQWAYCPYAGGTIADSGCGLVCAAMAVKYLTTQDVTPLTVADAVGDACLTDGVNDPAKFAQWIAGAYPNYAIRVAPTIYTLGEALGNVDSGWLCFAGLGGAFGDSEYNGHVVLIWRSDETGYWVRDPASPGNSARAFSADELGAVDFRYFVCLTGGNYGTARY